MDLLFWKRCLRKTRLKSLSVLMGAREVTILFRLIFVYVINIQFDIKTTIPNLTKLWQFDATYTGLNQFWQVWYNLDKFDLICTSLIQFRQVWLNLYKFDSIWTSLIQFGQVWSILDKFDPIWISLIELGLTSFDMTSIAIPNEWTNCFLWKFELSFLMPLYNSKILAVRVLCR